ncbi:TIGR00730 family Rossman fold protein [Bacillus kexueae]|uniref:LOG family protein n=1 Tax=Aeribacillus kexueae TaxID=2078952 RepID=UPI001FAEEC31|nr:TIGR00730 family Rossman fold protein [Bacillus kexueae]
MKRIAIFCGSKNGASEVYVNGAIALGKELANRNITLVYGGAKVGLMGAIADSVIQAGGNVIGVMPTFLVEKEIAHPHLSELIIVETMHERKAKMAELADGFIALPGGPGTLEEFFEIFTLAQLGKHHKPCGLFNMNHYYDPLIHFFSHMEKEQFLHEQYRGLAIIEEDPSKLLNRFEQYESHLLSKQTN